MNNHLNSSFNLTLKKICTCLHDKKQKLSRLSLAVFSWLQSDILNPQQWEATQAAFPRTGASANQMAEHDEWWIIEMNKTMCRGKKSPAYLIPPCLRQPLMVIKNVTQIARLGKWNRTFNCDPSFICAGLAKACRLLSSLGTFESAAEFWLLIIQLVIAQHDMNSNGCHRLLCEPEISCLSLNTLRLRFR